MRRLLPLLLLLLAGTPAAAQPWAPEPARAAGRAALAAAQAGRFAEAEALAAAADPLARKLVAWQRVQARGSGASASDIVGWLADNPDWPLPETIARRAEEALGSEPDDDLALRHFARHRPRTLEGAQRHADALARAGRMVEAAAAIRAGWVDGTPSEPRAEAAFADRHAATLTPEDHARRFDRLMWEGAQTAAARVVPRLAPARRPLAEARLTLRADADSPLRARDLGLAYERARFLRRADRDAEAAAVWRDAEPLQTDLPAVAARAIWAERQILSRKLLRLGDPAAAYRLAARHGQAEAGEPRQEGEFLAGFIALRFLNDATGAAQHFARVAEGSQSVITRARSAYWEGRALAAQGRAAEARLRYATAAGLPFAFYGQLASLALGETPAQLNARILSYPRPVPPPGLPEAFLGREMTRAAATLSDLGQPDRTRQFLLRMEDLAADAVDRFLIARLGVVLGRPDHGVWVARRSGVDGVVLFEDGWPTPWPAPEGFVEPALVHAITRQESNFELAAVSSANARGPMQLLPATAAGVARRLGVPHSLGMLTTDAAHNLRLGAAYLAEMLDRFGGALPLAAAAYNAGPARVSEWLGTYGDPRTPSGPDIRDWLEQIPFSETRNYAQRVMENLLIYRARAGVEAPHPLSPLLEGRP